MVYLVKNGALGHLKRWRWTCKDCLLFGPWEDRQHLADQGGGDHWEFCPQAPAEPEPELADIPYY